MRRACIPLISSLLLTAMFTGLWIAILKTVENPDFLFPGWFRPTFLVLAALIWLWGVVVAVRLSMHRFIKYSFVAAMALAAAGVISFLPTTEDPVINVFGFLAIVLGIFLADVLGIVVLVVALWRAHQDKELEP